MNWTLDSTHYDYITKEHLDSIPRRTQEKVYSVKAFEQLKVPEYAINHDKDKMQYLQFTGVWRRVKLPFNFFDGVHLDGRSKVDALISQKLRPFISLIHRALSVVKIDLKLYFSPICFWIFIYETYCYGKPLRDEDVQRCFSVSRFDDELSPILDDYSHSLKLTKIGKYDGVILPVETSRYYFEANFLSSCDDFRVFNSKGGKSVVWFRDSSLTIKSLQDEVELVGSRYYAFHVDQQLDRMHVFFFRSAEDLIRSMYFEIYRYWRDFVATYVTMSTVLKRPSYCLASNHRDPKLVLLSLISVLPPLREFDAYKFKTFLSFKSLIDPLIEKYSKRFTIKMTSLIRPFRSNILKYSPAPALYTNVWITNLNLSFDGNGFPEPVYKPFTLTSMTDPTFPLYDQILEPADDFIGLYDKREFLVDYRVLFTVRSFILRSKSLHTPDGKNGNLKVYRSDWYDERARTKDLYTNGAIVNQKNFFEVFPKWNEIVGLSPLLRAILNREASKPPDVRVKWNRSTLKLLSVLDRLDKHVGFVPEISYTIMICGVIDEPVIDLLKSAGYNFKILAIGDQARRRYERSRLSNVVYADKIDIIISDIDQASGVDEVRVSKLLIDEINWCLNLNPKYLIVKCQYTLVSVLYKLAKGLSDVRFNDVQLWKVLNSGPLGLESYIFFKISEDKSLNQVYMTLRNRLTEAYVQELAVMASPKPSVVRPPIIKSPSTVLEYRDGWSYEGNTIFVNRVSSDDVYSATLSAMLSVSDRVNAYPNGTVEFPGFLIAATSTKRRCVLSERSSIMGSLVDPQYDTLPRTFLPDATTNIKPMISAFNMTPDRIFNLVCKSQIINIIADLINDEATNFKLYDIGGRKLEGLIYTPLEFEYILVDKVNLPSFASKYSIIHINDHIDWVTIPKWLVKGSLIVIMFTVMNGVTDYDQVKTRIEYIRKLKSMGYKVIFNCYVKPPNDKMYAIYKETSAIRISDDRNMGSFGSYDLVPLLERVDIKGFKTHDLCIKMVIETCYYHGVVLSSELINYLDAYLDFCPLLS